MKTFRQWHGLNRIAIAALFYMLCHGSISAQIFDQHTEILAANGTSFDRFGEAVGVSGNTVVVGAPFEDTAGGTMAGAAYVYLRTQGGWSQQQRLVASDGQPSDFFGSAVAISGDTIVIGAYGDDDYGSFSGSSYVFVRSGSNWVHQAKLHSGSPGEDEQFGGSVAVAGNTIVIGSQLDDTTLVDAGTAYVFQRSGTTWSLQSTVTPQDPQQSAWFGFTVRIDNDECKHLLGSRGRHRTCLAQAR